MTELGKKAQESSYPLLKSCKDFHLYSVPSAMQRQLQSCACPRRHVQMHAEHRSPCTSAPGHTWVLVQAAHVEKANSYMTANAKLLGLTWASKQPTSLWASPEMCVEHPWSYLYTWVRTPPIYARIHSHVKTQCKKGGAGSQIHLNSSLFPQSAGQLSG